MVAVQLVCLNNIPQCILATYRVDDFLISGLLLCGKSFLPLHDSLDGFSLLGKVCGLYAVILCQFLCQLFRAIARCFHVQSSGQNISFCKCSFCHLPTQLRKLPI